MMAIYTQRLPSSIWRKIARETTNGQFRAQIMAEVDEHSPKDELRIRIDHIIEGVPPAAPSPDRAALVGALIAAAQAIRSQADIRFDDDGAKAIDTVLLGKLTTAVEAIEAKSEVE